MQISLSLLKTGIRNFRFLFSSQNLRFFSKFLFLLSKPENRKCHSLSLLKSEESFYKFLFPFSKLEKGISEFSFSSPNWRKEFQISLSLLDLTFWPLVNDCIRGVNILQSKNGKNWGRVLAVMLFTLEFKSVTNLDDESLLIWFENILSEMGLKEFDIPEHVFKTAVWSKSNCLLMAVTHVLLVFVYLIQTI